MYMPAALGCAWGKAKSKPVSLGWGTLSADEGWVFAISVPSSELVMFVPAPSPLIPKVGPSQLEFRLLEERRIEVNANGRLLWWGRVHLA